ncbi:MAG: hypothetical protein H6618_08835 [Deltaproteobacteria bacterium]|nr:hypothetical protein [Deltaproteobacteria bacterium]
MKLFSFLALMPMTLMAAGPVYYSDQLRHVELRSTSPSLLLFEAPAISVSCQPALVEFESLTKQTLALDEQNQVRAKSLGEDKKDDEVLLRRMIRIKPLRREGSSRCAFVLSNGDEVNAEFLLRETVITPLVEFKPFTSPESTTGTNQELHVLSSLLKGEPMGFLENRDDHKICSSGHRGQKSCINFRFDSKFATYEIVYLGKNAGMSAWIIKAILKKQASFKEAAGFNAKRGLVSFSLTTPQRNHYEKGEGIRHHIIAKASLTKEDLQGILP